MLARFGERCTRPLPEARRMKLQSSPLKVAALSVALSSCAMITGLNDFKFDPVDDAGADSATTGDAGRGGTAGAGAGNGSSGSTGAAGHAGQAGAAGRAGAGGGGRGGSGGTSGDRAGGARAAVIR